MIEEIIIYPRHFKSIPTPNGKGYCAKGMRLFCKKNNIDYLHFCYNGATIEEARKKFPNNSMIEAGIKEALKEYGRR